MIEKPISSDWHRVGAGLAVRFSMRLEKLEAEWQPRPPSRREWRRVIGRYRRARNSFLSVAAPDGKAVLVVEIDA